MRAGWWDPRASIPASSRSFTMRPGKPSQTRRCRKASQGSASRLTAATRKRSQRSSRRNPPVPWARIIVEGKIKVKADAGAGSLSRIADFAARSTARGEGRARGRAHSDDDPPPRERAVAERATALRARIPLRSCADLRRGPGAFRCGRCLGALPPIQVSGRRQRQALYPARARAASPADRRTSRSPLCRRRTIWAASFRICPKAGPLAPGGARSSAVSTTDAAHAPVTAREDLFDMVRPLSGAHLPGLSRRPVERFTGTRGDAGWPVGWVSAKRVTQHCLGQMLGYGLAGLNPTYRGFRQGLTNLQEPRSATSWCATCALTDCC